LFKKQLQLFSSFGCILLSDVIPQLKQFLKAASLHSSTETPKAQTQEYKLQLKLLKSLADFILGLQIEGKHLHDLMTVVVLYLSQAQPQELQTPARDHENAL